MSASTRQLIAMVRGIAVSDTGGDDGEFFVAVPIPGAPSHMIGRDAGGLIAVLIAIDSSLPLGPLPPVRLENLAVTHAARCVVSRVGEAKTVGVFSVVRCLTSDPRLVDVFVGVMSSVALQFPTPPSVSEAGRVLDRVIRLFRDLCRPSDRTLQGLWAELFVIAQSTNPTVLATAWRSSVFDRSDFAAANQRMEVKSTSGPLRVHTFNADQLRLPAGATGAVASLICERSAGGVSVADMWNIVRQHVSGSPAMLLRVDGIVAETLGDAWKESLDVRYDWRSARDSLRFFWMASIPSVGTAVPPEVTDIKFRVDLTRIQPAAPEELVAHGGLLAAAPALART